MSPQECGAMKDEEIARALRVGDATVGRVRRRCVEEGVEAALGRRQQGNLPPEEAGRPGRGPPDATSPVANRRRAVPVGRCNCWLTGWCNVR